MKHDRQIRLLAMLGLALCWLALDFQSGRVAGSASLVSEFETQTAQSLEWTGTASCSARSCHGGVGGRGDAGSEYTTWLMHDPHARAYGVLSTDRSRRMVQQLTGLSSPRDAHPETNEPCLRCHGPEVVNRKQPSDGFGCETCHGPAARWLTPHAAPDDWRKLTVAQRRDEYGMQPMRLLLERAQSCVGCHVGSALADVNHDLIAAGHPRLRFEFQTYFANLPPHWRERDDKPDFAARAWLTGQLTSARAALELLVVRAGDVRRPWPEFAEYDCLACHHDLREPSWRQQRGYGRHARGAFPFNQWYCAISEALTRPLAPLADAGLQGHFAQLRESMRKPRPVRATVADAAARAARDIERLIGKPQGLKSEVLLRSLLSDQDSTLYCRVNGSPTICNWDGAAQLTMAFRALTNGRDRAILNDLMQQLQAADLDHTKFFEIWNSARRKYQ